MTTGVATAPRPPLSRRALLGALAAAPVASMALASTASAEERRPVVVFAASSLQTTLDRLADVYGRRAGRRVTLSYASSAALARQIEQGAPADVFVSADRRWMKHLSDRGLIVEATMRDLVGNALVIIAPAGATVALRVEPGFDLAGAAGDGRIAMGVPGSVPAGTYAREALETLGVWDAVAKKIAGAENARAALALVARGEAPLGIVYATDARAEPGVRIVAAFPEDAHTPIVYPIALVAASTNPDAADVLAFLLSDEARAAFEEDGFRPPARRAEGG
jgi:molybdate transport system substrate-binding protein